MIEFAPLYYAFFLNDIFQVIHLKHNLQYQIYSFLRLLSIKKQQGILLSSLFFK
jgi:hypothetical protein